MGLGLGLGLVPRAHKQLDERLEVVRDLVADLDAESRELGVQLVHRLGLGALLELTHLDLVGIVSRDESELRGRLVRVRTTVRVRVRVRVRVSVTVRAGVGVRVWG